MLSRLLEWSLRNQVFMVVLLLLAVAGGVWAVKETRVDAIPDLSDVQVIVYTEYSGRGPRVVEDQVTFPIVTKMLSVPHAKVVRGYSFFGYSFVYVIFEDGTDIYWARARVLEYLSGLAGQIPEGASPRLGPDATGVGWAFMYVLNSESRSLAELRSLQDWYLRYGLVSVDGVSEVASIGGFVRQYQVEVDPVKMRAYGVPLGRIKQAIQRSNIDVGGRLLEMGEREFIVRGLGYVKDIADLERVSLGVGGGGAPILLRDVARVSIGPEIRRGIAEWNGRGETVGGIVVVRHGADTRNTITAVKERLAELKKGLPSDVEISVAYDRTGLIERSIETLTHTLIEESIIVGLVCAIFLFHLRSALVAIFSIPISILLSFLLMKLQGIGANIMSLGGIAISIGVLVDASIVMVENAHKHYEEWRDEKSHFEIVLQSAKEVGPTLFWSLLVITVSFIPVFTLEGPGGPSLQAARLHQDLHHGDGRPGGDHDHPRSHVLAGPGPDSGRGAPPDLPGASPGLHPGPAWGSPSPVAGDRRRRGPVGGHVLSADPHRLGVHAGALGGRPPLHADHLPRDLDHQGQGDPAADGPDHRRDPRSGVGDGQDRAGRHRHRSRPALDDRDHHHPEGSVGVAGGDDPEEADLGARRRRPVSPASPTRGPCRSGPGSTCSPPGSGPRWGSRSGDPTWRSSRTSAGR